MQNQKLYSIDGVKISAVSAGIKKAGRLDVVLFELCEGATVAGVYTRNAFCAAPVVVAKKHSTTKSPRYFLINTGNANAGTGEAGMQAALECCTELARVAGVATEEILPFSTGVIGEALPVNKITAVFPQALNELSVDAWQSAALGIMTTDTVPKSCSEKFQLAGKTVTITGIAKGAGMIKPNMATMLAYICTDAEIDQQTLSALCSRAADRSFNRITVDGDTSTNDCCMLVASCRGKLKYADLDEAAAQQFELTLNGVFQTLAQAIIRDAEGATKFVTLTVEEGKNSEECLQVAYAIAESPLVKTALFASDPNWGRIAAALGRAGLKNLDINKVRIYLDTVCIVRNGGRDTNYTEALGQAVMSKSDIEISVKLGRGESSERVWTCDLSYDYVKINAEYRS